MNNFIKRYIIASYILAIPFIIAFLFFKDWKSLILGILFSNTIRILLFKLSAIELDNIINKPKRTAKALATANYIKRFIIYGITLTVAHKSPSLNFFSAAIGLLLLSFAIQIINIIDIKKSGKHKNVMPDSFIYYIIMKYVSRISYPQTSSAISLIRVIFFH